MEWYKPKDQTLREQYPCCDYISLAERGNFLICKICFWEDDGLDVNEPDVPSASNHGITLREGRRNFENFGACEKEMLEHVLPAAEQKKFNRVLRTLDEP
jgi:Cysteine-rich CPCC